MHEVLVHTVTVFMGFLAIMNPLANTPIFLALTRDDDAKTRRAVAFRGLALAFVMIAVFSALGHVIFEMFGIGLPGLRIVGGLLVFKIGLDMIQGEGSKAHTPSDAEVQGSREAALSVAVSPLAIPILAGPGTIATAMNFASGKETLHLLITIAAFGVLCVVSYFFFVGGEKLVRFLGAAGLSVITRLMGLILATIGVQMLVEGIQGAFKR